MSETTHRGDAPARGDWSQVFTNLDWVARWMADHGYTDAEIAYVVARPGTTAVATEVSPAPVDAPPAPQTAERAGTRDPAWTIPLTASETDTAPAEGAPIGSDGTDDPRSTESVSA